MGAPAQAQERQWGRALMSGDNARATVGGPIFSEGAGRGQGQGSVQAAQVCPQQTGRTILQCQIEPENGRH